MKDFQGNEINQDAMTQAIASIDWSKTEGDDGTRHLPDIPLGFPEGKIVCRICGENWPCPARQKEIAAEQMHPITAINIRSSSYPTS